MYNSWYDVFPEIVMISDKELQKKVVETYEEALKTGGWQLNDIDTIPFTLLIPDTVISYRTHVRTVTRMSMKAYEEWEVYGEKFKLNKDYLLAGALLHDVGKLIEYEKTADGKTQKSQLGKNLRHNHAKEGDGTLRSPEGVIVNKCDMLNFEGLKAFVGMI